MKHTSWSGPLDIMEAVIVGMYMALVWVNIRCDSLLPNRICPGSKLREKHDW